MPSSVIAPTYCRTQQQVAATAHQIARAATLYGTSEIVIYNVDYDEINQLSLKPEEEVVKTTAEPVAGAPKKLVFTDELDEAPAPKESTKKDAEKDADLKRLEGFLRYFVTPSYLRKTVFGDLKPYECAKKLPKLPNVPFLSHNASGRYIEGLSVAKKVEKPKKKSKAKDTTSFVNIGAAEYLELSNGSKIPVNARVVVDTSTKSVVTPAEAYGRPVPTSPESNTTWTTPAYGYSVRTVSNFGAIFTECPHPSGYKFTAWVPCSEFSVSTTTSAASEHALERIEQMTAQSFLKKGIDTEPSEPAHILLVFGKWKEVAASISADSQNLGDVKEPESLFDGRVRMSRATRVEDAVMIALAKIDGI